MKILFVDSNESRRKEFKLVIDDKFIKYITPWSSIRNERNEYISIEEYAVLILHHTDILKEEKYFHDTILNSPVIRIIFSGGVLNNELKDKSLYLNDLYLKSNINKILEFIIDNNVSDIKKIYKYLFSSGTKEMIIGKYTLNYIYKNLSMLLNEIGKLPDNPVLAENLTVAFKQLWDIYKKSGVKNEYLDNLTIFKKPETFIKTSGPVANKIIKYIRTEY